MFAFRRRVVMLLTMLFFGCRACSQVQQAASGVFDPQQRERSPWPPSCPCRGSRTGTTLRRSTVDSSGDWPTRLRMNAGSISPCVRCRSPTSSPVGCAAPTSPDKHCGRQSSANRKEAAMKWWLQPWCGSSTRMANGLVILGAEQVLPCSGRSVHRPTPSCWGGLPIADLGSMMWRWGLP
jgi:hypothetical protein